MSSIGSAYIGKYIGEIRQKKIEKVIKRIEDARRRSEAFVGRESEQSNFMEAPYISQNKLKKQNSL